MEAVEEQLRRGFHLGPQSRPGRAHGRLFRELTGMERVTFCNTGSEAVMTALRIARTVTGRERSCVFEGSYHGCFDGVLARGRWAGPPRSRPVAPRDAAGDGGRTWWCSPTARARWSGCAANAAEAAAVLVEPVQSRNPEHHPREFLRELRALTARSGRRWCSTR
jgi:glutamate-1-semialdehyde aminotransferase